MTEYAVIIAAIAAALAAMGIFFKAGLQKRLWGLSSELGDKAYAPRFTTSSSQAAASSTSTETYKQGVSQVLSNESTQRSSDETVTFETRWP